MLLEDPSSLFLFLSFSLLLKAPCPTLFNLPRMYLSEWLAQRDIWHTLHLLQHFLCTRLYTGCWGLQIHALDFASFFHRWGQSCFVRTFAEHQLQTEHPHTCVSAGEWLLLLMLRQTSAQSSVSVSPQEDFLTFWFYRFKLKLTKMLRLCGAD